MFVLGWKCHLAGAGKGMDQEVEVNVLAVVVREAEQISGEGTVNSGFEVLCFFFEFFNHVYRAAYLNQNLLLSQDIFIRFTPLPHPNSSRIWLKITNPLLFLVDFYYGGTCLPTRSFPLLVHQLSSAQRRPRHSFFLAENTNRA